MYNKITAVEAKKIMDDHKKVTVLDVREPDELVEGYIENSKLIPLDEVPERAERELDKSIPVLVYCRSVEEVRWQEKFCQKKVIRSMILVEL